MPLLTTQSAKGYGFGSGASVAPISTSYVSLGSVKLASNQTSVTFSSIPATYKHLQVRIFQQKSSGGNDAILMHLNGDFTNGNYAYYSFLGDGTSTVQSLVDSAVIGSARSNGWNNTVITIPDYASTAKVKSYQSLSGSSSQTASAIFYVGTMWDNTAAINAIRLTVSDGNPFITGSVFALYGIKG
jgi:hypothetical protein